MDLNKSYDVFISYRRRNQPIYAQMVYHRLDSDGYRVFLDVNGLGHGTFDDQLYRVIENVSDLILILPSGALDGCSDPEDWIRKEVSHALKNNINVIPYLLPDFKFPDNLPEDLAILPRLNGPTYSVDYFKESLDRLESYMNSRPLRKGAGPAAPEASREEALSDSAPEPPEDSEPLEPEPDFAPLPPTKKTAFGLRYSREDVRRARADLQKRLEEQSSAIGGMLKQDRVGSRSAYRSVRMAMMLVKDLMGAYDFWPYEDDSARTKFEKLYETSVARFGRYAEEGNRWLSEDLIRLLRQYNRGLRELIQKIRI